MAVPSPHKARLANNLKQARISAGLSQAAAAKIVDKSRQTIVNWESGLATPEPDEDELGALASAYGVPPTDLRYGTVQRGAHVSPAQSTGAVSEPFTITARHARHPPLRVRDFLKAAREEMEKAEASEEEIAGALALMQSEVNFVHAHGGTGAMREFNEEDVLKSMRAIYNGRIKRQLRAWGRKIE